MDKAAKLKKEILAKTEEYYRLVHDCSGKEFVPDKSCINYGGRVFDEKEMTNLVDSALEFWLTHGRYAFQFEKELAALLGVKHALLINSGSSANLLAFGALTSPGLKNRRIKRGDEIITVAAGFPTTVTPIIQYGAVPVFVDVDLPTANVDVSKLERALSRKTKAVMLAHTLGNPFDLKAVKAFCRKHKLWLIEDNCDALGSKYNGRYTGTFGDIATSSFFPAHHITTGEGGAVYTNNARLSRIVLSMRDWGRDCWCQTGKDNTCARRFSHQFKRLPKGYDHKYVYSHFGYNMKATDMQAAVGCAQLKKLKDFTKKRQANFNTLYERLKDCEDEFILPQRTKMSEPSWFGFLLTVRDPGRFARLGVVQYLESRKIQTRNLFAGNFIHHPCFDSLHEGRDYRIVGRLINTNKIMKDSFWLGVYPGMKKKALEFMGDQIHEYLKKTTDNNTQKMNKSQHSIKK